MAPLGPLMLYALMVSVHAHFGHNYKLRTAHEAITMAQKSRHHVVRQKMKAEVGYALGHGYCLNIDTQHNATADFLGDHDCAALCRGYTYFACHGYASGVGICHLYASNALQAQRPALVTEQEHDAGVKCYVLKPTYSADFPLVAISSSDLVGCYDGNVTALGLGETQVTSNLDYVHVREGDAHGFYASFCARQCQRFRYFLLKSHIAVTGRGSNKCFCVERLDHEKNLDRLVGNSYFGTKLSNSMCPSWNCVHDATGCVWQLAWDKHVAIYRTPTPQDGEACPDHLSSHDHQSNFVYVSGSNGRVTTSGWYREMQVASPSDCAKNCFLEGPSVRSHIDSRYNETCHGYYVHRNRQFDGSSYTDATFDDFRCYLYNNPIPHSDIANYHTYDNVDRARGVWSNYLCVLRTCIEDTPCAWNMGENFRRIHGFQYTSNSTRIPLPSDPNHCDLCANACALDATCSAYQCSISTNHCYLFTDSHADVQLQVSDVSLCVKSSNLTECTYQNGAKPVLYSENPCRCGGEVCAEGDYCVADPVLGSQCGRSCPCVYTSGSPTDADKVCSAKNVTFPSECALRCANETMEYFGSCTGAICSSTVDGIAVATEPCLCQKGAESTLCPVDSLCYANGTCSPTCEQLFQQGETEVCGSDGTEYPSRCSMPTGVTVNQTGPCPIGSCVSGQSDCKCHNETCSAGSATTTQCVLDCTGLACGCVAPCENLESKNDANTTKANVCGCDTTNDGYIVCDGHCHVNAAGNTTCIKTCPSDGECVCGTSVCDNAVCDSTADPPVCRQPCSSPDDTGCTCQASNSTSSTEFCTNETRCLPLLGSTNDTELCAPECVGLAADNVTCYCVGAGSDVHVCHPPESYCSVTAGATGGKCVAPECENGTTDCLCGVEACVSDPVDGSTYCAMASGKCYPNCDVDNTQTDCFCPSGNATNTSSLCLTNPEDLNSVQNMYCIPTANGAAAACVHHCTGVNGTSMLDTTECPCGVGALCGAEEHCVHLDDALSGQCLINPINESCYNITSNTEEQLGLSSVSKACYCGGSSCPEGSFCDSMTGTCSSTRIVECNVTEPVTCTQIPCRCGNADYHTVCSKNDICLASFSSSVL